MRIKQSKQIKMPRGGKRVGAGRRRKSPLPNGATNAPVVPPLETLKPEVTKKITSRGNGDRLSAGERRFIDEYLIDLNASAAYLRAGYKGDKGGASAARMLGRDRVQAAIARAMAERSKRVHVDQDRVLTELARIAFADRRKFFETVTGEPVKAEHLYAACRNTDWSLPWEQLSPTDQAAWTHAAQLLSERTRAGFYLKNPDELDDDLGAAFEGVEVVMKKDAVGEVERIHKVTAAAKIPALTLLGRHLGMFHEKGAPTGGHRDREVDDKASDADLLERAEALLAKARGRLTSGASA